jgi:hypothetical protein
VEVEINPGRFFDRLAQIASGQSDEDWPVLLWVDHLGGDEEAGRVLHAPALRMLTVAELLTILATQAWGEPDFALTSRRMKPPEWMEPYCYPNGVPVVLHYLTSWRRERARGQRRQAVAAFVYIEEHDGGRPGWWQLRLNLGLHEF